MPAAERPQLVHLLRRTFTILIDPGHQNYWNLRFLDLFLLNIHHLRYPIVFKPHKSLTSQIGNLGEQLVCDRLQSFGWTITARQWKCRWGELDIIALRDRDLKFIEVKTRNNRNWDALGALAISTRKQRRLIHTAQFFLQHNPEYSSLNCTFDVALVSISDRQHLHLHQYIDSAFEL